MQFTLAGQSDVVAQDGQYAERPARGDENVGGDSEAERRDQPQAPERLQPGPCQQHGDQYQQVVACQDQQELR